MVTRLVGVGLILVMVAGAQVRTPKKKRIAEAPIIWSGNQIHDLCSHYKNEKLKGSLGPGCFMYIAGVSQTLISSDEDAEILKSPCPGSMVTQEQIVDVVVKWIDDHPDKRDQSAPFIVMWALNEAFPCR